MENKTALILFSALLSLSCFITESRAKKQIEALSHFYNEKLRNNIGIDRSHFNASHHDFLGVQIHPQEGMKENDRIQRLPGQPQVQFKQYGGYITVDQTGGRAFYYYFTEAQNSEKSLPLLLWLNGGPGCFSLGYGAMEELGPFRVHSDGKTLYENKFAWNHAANVLFLESPAGVGFSYSNTTADLNGGDRRTAIDNYAFLVNWLERFPEYKNRDFFIAGESYAGHYVPQLAHTILYYNHKAKKTIINLKGVIIGNGVINDETDEKGVYEYCGSHALASDETIDIVLKHCDFSSNATKQSDECIEAGDQIDIGRINIFNIYAPLCFNPSLTEKPKKTSEMNFDPCSDDYVHAYMNRPEVQKALHANVTKLPYDWQHCSGDTDARIPVTSTKHSIKLLKLPIKISWHPWYTGGEVGGYTQVYEGDLTFATVRGAGHEVPSYQPARALSLIMHFLAGKHLPTSENLTMLTSSHN